MKRITMTDNNKKNWKVLFSIALLSLFAAPPLTNAESFGRNKVQYEYLHWEYIETPSFRIYYVEGYETLGRFAAEILEDAYPVVSSDLSQDVLAPVPVIIFPSPGEFQETNIITSILGEGTGGFTEILKTRVVVPFNGSYEDFRHVLVHEMAHAVTFDKLIGRGPTKLLSSGRIFELPLWLAEGISEFESICWDVESDMYLRDAVLNNYTVPFSRLGGFLAYKEGASVVGYIARRYGRKKIGEILGKGQVHISADAAMKAALGRTQDELYEDWLDIKKREYFPEFGIRRRPEDIADRITDHEEDGSYFNVMPAFSPDGHRVAFISNRNDYIDLFVADVITGQLELVARGERSGEAQSFHPFRSRAGWSEKGEYIAYSRKSGGSDEIAIRESNKWKMYKTMRFDSIREISSPVFLPDDMGLIFSGLEGDRTDLYITGFDNNLPRKLTDDRWDDRFPSVSPDGRYVAFASDRPINGGDSDNLTEPEQGQISPEHQPERMEFRFGHYNVWILDVEEDTLAPLTTDGLGNGQPVWSPDGKSIAYTSERNGIRNIWIAELGDSVVHRPYTDLLSGAFTPTWDPDGKKLVFSAFYNGGFDLFYAHELVPLDSISPTPYMLARDTLRPPEDTTGSAKRFAQISGDLRRYSFSSGDEEDDREYSLEPEKYTPQFSVDLVSGTLGYDTYYGFTGYTYLVFSDVMGNQQIVVATDFFEEIENTNFFVYYAYLAQRYNIGGQAYRYKNYFLVNDELFSDDVFGSAAFIEYPFSQFNRIQFIAEAFIIDRDYWDSDINDIMPFNLRLEFAAVRDNSLWKNTGPVAGTRAKIALEYVPPIDNDGMDYYGGRLDLRRYIHFGNGYGFAMRAAAGGAWGNRAPTYWLGGSDNWLNWRLATEDIYSIDKFYFSRMITPLRGHPYFAYKGNIYALGNLEIRYPFVEQMDLGMPPITISGINGALFMDIGAVSGHEISEFTGWRNGRLEDIKMSLGVGTRAWIWMFLFYYDLAWSTDLYDIADKPVHHFGLGAEF